jgi:hypothetical protein
MRCQFQTRTFKDSPNYIRSSGLFLGWSAGLGDAPFGPNFVK